MSTYFELNTNKEYNNINKEEYLKNRKDLKLMSIEELEEILNQNKSQIYNCKIDKEDENLISNNSYSSNHKNSSFNEIKSLKFNQKDKPNQKNEVLNIFNNNLKNESVNQSTMNKNLISPKISLHQGLSQNFSGYNSDDYMMRINTNQSLNKINSGVFKNEEHSKSSNAMTNAMKALQEKIRNLNTELNNLKEQLRDNDESFKKEKAELQNKYINEINKSRDVEKHYLKEIEQLKVENRELMNSLEKFKNDVNLYKSNLNILENDKSRHLEKNLHEKQTLRDTLEDLMNENEYIKQKHQDAIQENQNIKRNFENSLKEIKELKEILEKIQKELRENRMRANNNEFRNNNYIRDKESEKTTKEKNEIFSSNESKPKTNIIKKNTSKLNNSKPVIGKKFSKSKSHEKKKNEQKKVKITNSNPKISAERDKSHEIYSKDYYPNKTEEDELKKYSVLNTNNRNFDSRNNPYDILSSKINDSSMFTKYNNRIVENTAGNTFELNDINDRIFSLERNIAELTRNYKNFLIKINCETNISENQVLKRKANVLAINLEEQSEKLVYLKSRQQELLRNSLNY